MTGKIIGRCNMCGNDNVEVIDLPGIYVFGSEGVQLCDDCKMLVVKFIGDVSRRLTKAKLDTIKKVKNGKEPI